MEARIGSEQSCTDIEETLLLRTVIILTIVAILLPWLSQNPTVDP